MGEPPQEANVATPEYALQYFPLGPLYSLTVPFPWQLGAVRQNLIIPENAFWLGLYPLMVVGIRRVDGEHRDGIPNAVAGLVALGAVRRVGVGSVA